MYVCACVFINTLSFHHKPKISWMVKESKHGCHVIFFLLCPLPVLNAPPPLVACCGVMYALEINDKHQNFHKHTGGCHTVRADSSCRQKEHTQQILKGLFQCENPEAMEDKAFPTLSRVNYTRIYLVEESILATQMHSFFFYKLQDEAEE